MYENNFSEVITAELVISVLPYRSLHMRKTFNYLTKIDYCSDILWLYVVTIYYIVFIVTLWNFTNLRPLFIIQLMPLQLACFGNSEAIQWHSQNSSHLHIWIGSRNLLSATLLNLCVPMMIHTYIIHQFHTYISSRFYTFPILLHTLWSGFPKVSGW